MSSPFGPMVLVANPSAGRGRAAAHLPAIEDELRSRGLEHRVVVTEGPGHAMRATREAIDAGERFIVAVGGDGTINEVVNGMIEDDEPLLPNLVLGAVSAGSGADFVKTFGLPDEAIAACAHLDGSNTHPIDLGKVTYRPTATRHDSEPLIRYFANIAEAGLGGAVVARAERLPRRLRGSRYFFGFWLTLPGYRRSLVRVDADRRSYEGRVHNVVVANGQFYGGGMRISPRSWPGDGFLDVLVMKGPKSDAFTILPKVYRGEHLPHRDIVELRTRRVGVDGDRPLPIEADGEVLGTTPAIFELIPRAIQLKI
jgi:diacylglycerol kinase (ATP)